ncbi:MAG: GspE/PulE family protein [Candidatus Pacebacteria bacterium]|nr:GspE/PulE family protein [Candidatus Paceibacterota bacterium]
MTFGEVLVKNNIISNDLLFKSKKEADETGADLEEILVKRNISADEITKAKSEVFGLPIKKVEGSLTLPFEIIKNIPEESVRFYKFAPLGVEEGVMEVGIVNPDDMEAREALQFLSSKLNMPFKLFLISSTDLKNALNSYQSLGGETVKILDELESVIAQKTLPEDIKQAEEMATSTEEAPITKMVAVIIRHAIEGRASDIHIEPLYDRLKVRFRVDGVLYTSLTLPKKVHEAVVARIKILTNMKLDEKRKPQDGRFEAGVGGKRIDFRVSTFPTFYGEKIVIRILDATKGLKKLEEVGLLGRNLKMVKEGLEKPYGMILITGPTGSGKTTTLYAMLNLLDKEKSNAVSLEDPIEYNLEGMSQSQVRPEIGYDFASGLRSILRQDPDVIMVGEIRDKETARLAVQSALTGHLVFSTLHTNTATGVIPRLIDMGVDPFLIPATLISAISQRLVGTLCPESKKGVKVSGTVRAMLEEEIKQMPAGVREKVEIPDTIYQALPSAQCPRGTRGRIGIFEVMSMTPELEKIILTNPGESAIMKEAFSQGMITMRQDGILKVLDGTIGLEQLREII